MYKRILTAGLLFGMVSTGPPALAAGCASRDAITDKLSTAYEETLTATGLQNADALIEIWSSEKTGSFTILVTRPDGISCVVSTGQNWSTIPATAPPDGIAG